MADRPDLGYTEAVLHESMRLATVAPTGIMHMTAGDTDVGKPVLFKLHDIRARINPV